MTIQTHTGQRVYPHVTLRIKYSLEDGLKRQKDVVGEVHRPYDVRDLSVLVD